MTKKQINHSASFTEKQSTAIPQVMDVNEQERSSVASRHFFYNDTSALKNKYNIKDKHALNQKVSEDVKEAMEQLRAAPFPGKIDSSYLKHIHKCLFSKAFEWAGQTREKPFQFADGSLAFTPIIKKKEFQSTFAPSEQIEEGLKNLDQVLAEKDYLKNLSHEEFVQHAAGLMINLQHMHPFREGNSYAIQVFVEKLGQAVGHPLDFSLVTKKRKMLANVEAIDKGNPEPMKHLLEDISNPQKVRILNEFTNEMENLGLDKNNYGPVIVAQDGHTYHGTYRGSGQEGFMIDANGTLILGNKKDLSPKQLKELKIGDTCSFTAPFPQKSQKILIPEQILAPLSQKEIVDKIQNDLLIQERKKEIVDLCKIVYGKSHVLEETLRKIDANPNTRSEFLGQIDESIRSISKLSGFEICGVKNRARTRAEQNISSLEINLCLYINSVIDLERNIIKDHFAEQRRCNKSVEMPSQQIKGLFSLSKEQQQEALSTSPGLEAQVKEYFQKFSERLSPSEHEAIKQKDYTRLAESLDVSTNQAEQIAKFFKQTEAISDVIRQHNREMGRHIERGLRQPIMERNKEKYTKQDRAPKQQGRQHKVGYVAWGDSGETSGEKITTPTKAENVAKSTNKEKTLEEQGQHHRAKSMAI
ncbi:BID domain-containing T4SS effector [Bartonella sp. B39]